MGPIFIAVVAGQVQTALCLLCVAIAFATPTGRRNLLPTLMLFAGATLGGFLGFMAWYGTALTLLWLSTVGGSFLAALAQGWIVVGSLCLAYAASTATGGWVGWHFARRLETSRRPDRLLATPGGILQ